MYRAIQIIKHTLGLIFNNQSAAMRITLPWILVVVVLFVALEYVAPNGTNFYKKNTSIEGVVLFAAIFIVAIVGFLSCAINWHCFVLLGRIPQGSSFIPAASILKPYFIRSLGIFFIILFIAAILSLFLSIISPILLNLFGSNIIVTLFFVPVSFALQYILLRLGICLPAIALGNFDITLNKAWSLSHNESQVILYISVIITLVETVLPIIMQQIFNGFVFPQAFNYIYFLGGIIFNCIYLLFSIGILTSLYGIIIEDRKI